VRLHPERCPLMVQLAFDFITCPVNNCWNHVLHGGQPCRSCRATFREYIRMVPE
jgi:hypothetical protein